MQLIPTDIRTWWNDWELRLIILFSAFLQVILVTLGSRRKFINSLFLRALVWATYLIASWTAILALGMLSNRLVNIKEKTGILGPNDKLTAFWAPFLLLHIGGPDSITSYSLEDNELWLRSFAVLVAKTVLTGYVYFLALTGSPLAVLAATMTAVGFIKLGERTLSLYFSSKDPLRDSMLSPPESGPIYPKITEQYSLKKDEGYQVAIDEVVEIATQGDLVAQSHNPKPGEEKATTLRQAYGLFQIFKLLFVELILNVNDLGNCKNMFMLTSSERAFEIVAVELGFMYDLLYTKAILFYTISGIYANAILHSMWGIACRVITLSLTCAVLIFFCIQEWKNYSRVDIRITFSLLGVAILLECHSILQMISSDWASTWLLKNQNTYRGCIIRFLQLLPHGSKSWSNSVAQFSLIKFSLRRSPWLVRAIHWPRKAEKHLQKLCRVIETKMQSCVTHKDFRDNMREWICMYLKNQACNENCSVISYKEARILQRASHPEMAWSTEDIEFDQSILIWHIATELCYYNDRSSMARNQGEFMNNYKMSKMVSRYLLYLLVMHPSMIPAGIGLLRYADTSQEAQKYFKENSLNDERQCLCGMTHKSDESRHQCQASGWLLGVNTDILPSVVRGGNSKSVLFDGCRLASQLKKIEPLSRRWSLISQVWAQALFYSAYCCEGHEHAKQLSEGGELLSHVWLLMAHFGISKQLETSQCHAVVRILTK